MHQFTIGQRKGLGFAAGKPLYVLSIDRENNRVVVGDDESLRQTTCEVENVNWIAIENPSEPVRAQVKIRHKHIPADATVEPLDATRARVTSTRRSAPSPQAKARSSTTTTASSAAAGSASGDPALVVDGKSAGFRRQQAQSITGSELKRREWDRHSCLSPAGASKNKTGQTECLSHNGAE